MTVWRPSPLVRAQWTRKNVIFPENQAIKSPFLSLKLLWRAWREWLLPLQIFIAHSRWNLFLQVSEQERFLESQVVHFGIGTPSRILKLIQNGEQALFVISRLQIAPLHAFSHDARLLSKPRSSPSILVLRHDHGTRAFLRFVGKVRGLELHEPRKTYPCMTCLKSPRGRRNARPAALIIRAYWAAIAKQECWFVSVTEHA